MVLFFKRHTQHSHINNAFKYYQLWRKSTTNTLYCCAALYKTLNTFKHISRTGQLIFFLIARTLNMHHIVRYKRTLTIVCSFVGAVELRCSQSLKTQMCILW